MHYGVATISRLLRITVSFAKVLDQRDYIPQKRPIIWRSLLIVATPFVLLLLCLRIHRERGEGGWERERETERERLICDMSYLIRVTHMSDSFSWHELPIQLLIELLMIGMIWVAYMRNSYHEYESLIRCELLISSCVWVTHTTWVSDMSNSYSWYSYSELLWVTIRVTHIRTSYHINHE